MAVQYIYDTYEGLTRLEIVTVDNSPTAVNLAINFQVHSDFTGYGTAKGYASPEAFGNTPFGPDYYFITVKGGADTLYNLSGRNGVWPGGVGWQTNNILFCGAVARSYGTVTIDAQYRYRSRDGSGTGTVVYTAVSASIPAYIPPDGGDALTNYASLTLGTANTFTITNNTAYAHSDVLTCILGSSETEIATVNVPANSSATYSWTPPASLGAQIPASMSGSGMIRLTTKNGGTTIAAQNYGATFTVPAYTYTISGSISKTKMTYSSVSSYVAGKTTVKFTMPSFPSAQYGASLSGALRITSPSGQTMNMAITSGGTYSLTGSDVGTYTAVLTVTDSRSKTAQKSTTAAYVANPSVAITAFSAIRTGQTESVPISASATYDSTLTGNTATLTVTKNGTVISTQAGSSGSASVSLTDTLAAAASAEYIATITDYLGNTASQAVTVTQQFKFHQVGGGDLGHGISFGMAASLTGEDSFEVGLPGIFTDGIYKFRMGPVTISGANTWELQLWKQGVKRIGLNLQTGLTFYGADGSAVQNYPSAPPPTQNYWRVNDTLYRLRASASDSGTILVSNVPLGDYPYLGTSGSWVNIYYSDQYPSAWISNSSGTLVNY